MRIKEIFWMLGLHPSAKTYGTSVTPYVLPEAGTVEVAQWLHPKAGVYKPVQEEVNELKKILSPGDAAIDVGAYIGDTAIPMALATGKTGVVFALEPNRYAYKVLEQNAALNTDKTNIIPLNFAATPADGEMKFEYSDPGYCNGGVHENISKWSHGHAFKLKVQGKNLVHFLKENDAGQIPKIKFIKIDAEGFDLTVLESLAELVTLCRPFIWVEVFVNSNEAYRKKMYAFFKNHQYDVRLFNGQEQYDGGELKETDMMKLKHFDIFARPL